jgi:hypothetical protein
MSLGGIENNYYNMSSNHQQLITCSSCGHIQSFTIWDSVNVTTDPKLKDMLCSEHLTTFICQSCGNEAHIEYDCLYHDMDRSLVVWLKYNVDDGGSQIDHAAKTMSAAFQPNYTRRRVQNFHELLDKINVFSDGFSDFEIELFKLLICIHEGIDMSLPFHYSRIESSILKGKYIVFALQTEYGFEGKRYPYKKYTTVVKPIMPKILPFLKSS